MAPANQLERNVVPPPGQSAWHDPLRMLWNRMRLRWLELSPSQRRWTSAAVLSIAAISVGLLWYGLRTDWRTLYVGLDPDDARQIVQVLNQAGISYQATTDGTGIRVPVQEIDKARLATAAKGSVKSGRLGFELFDKPNWVGSEFDERVNYQRALEGELEKTVSSLSDVASARVHLVLPHDSLFRDQDRPGKASVVIKLRHRSLADGEADAIRNLVASAVDGLTPDRVVLVDADGHLPLGPKTAEAMKLSAEEALEEKLVTTLEPVTGPGNVRASVTVDYNDQANEVTQEIYDPDKSATLSMQRTEQTAGSQPIAAGVPGTASNAPNTQTLPVYPQQSTAPQSAKTESGTYGVSKTVRHSVENPGHIRRLTAAIVVNDRLMQRASRGKTAVWQPWPPEQLRNLTQLAQASIGYDASRGDLLTVEDLAFEGNQATIQAPMPEQVLTQIENFPVLVKYVTIFLCLLSVLLWGVRPVLRHAMGPASSRASRKNAVKPAVKELPESSQTSLESSEISEADPERIRAQQIFDQVAEHLKQEPTQSSRLLQSWIHSE